MPTGNIEESTAPAAGRHGAVRLLGSVLRWLPYGVLAGLFAWSVSRCYLPGKGFSYFIEFGEMNHGRYLPEVNDVRHFELPDSPGYDAQWYVQIAMRPRLGDPVLASAVDILRYRARRILFELTAWAAGGGDPARVMNAFALQNVVCWFLLAALLLRWFPPSRPGNALRWAFVLCSVGLIFSVRAALLDGPSLLLVAAAMALLETGHPWWAASLLGISGLGKETSVLGAAALGLPAPGRRGPWIGRLALVLCPIALWTLCLWLWLGIGNSAGAHNFSAPFVALAKKALGLASLLRAQGGRVAPDVVLDLLALLGLLVQAAFFILRLRWGDPWWRLGASCAALGAFLGDSVWGNYPTAAARVLLPMTLAFNVQVPRGRWWVLVLLAGNIGVVGSPGILTPPARGEYYMVGGDPALRAGPGGRLLEAQFGPDNWYRPEEGVRPGGTTTDFWRWSRGDAAVIVTNPQPFAVVADISFSLACATDRSVRVTLGPQVLWSGQVLSGRDNPAGAKDVELPPGETRILFHSDRPATPPGPADSRQFAYSVRNLSILLRRAAPAVPVTR